MTKYIHRTKHEHLSGPMAQHSAFHQKHLHAILLDLILLFVPGIHSKLWF